MRYLLLLLSLSALGAVPFMSISELEELDRSRGASVSPPLFTAGGDWQSWSYPHEFFQTAEFIAGMQVSDSSSPDFGGIVEGEDMTDVIQTDNTQEAVWVWCWYTELTGDTSYVDNIRKAWTYVMNHPAYEEEGEDSDYYRDWNCGLALFAELKYRQVFGDSSYMDYADSCISYMFSHPLDLNTGNSTLRRLHPKVTALEAGMLYAYGIHEGRQELIDTAIAYGNRVKEWVEEDPETRLNDEVWAMSGGTIIWGLCKTVFSADTAQGISWLGQYMPLLEYFEPSGDWSNSWNIWYANGYRAAYEISGDELYCLYHHALTDSLIVQDLDDDGGVPPTRWGSSNGDHSWVSSYMVFMGIYNLADSLLPYDAGIGAFLAPDIGKLYLPGDTLSFAVRVLNYGLSALYGLALQVEGPMAFDTVIDLPLGGTDTLNIPQDWIPSDSGNFEIKAYTDLPGDGRSSNDTAFLHIRIHPFLEVTGEVRDGNTGSGIEATLYFDLLDLLGDTSLFWDSTVTDPLSGQFSIVLTDTAFAVTIVPVVPYPVAVETLYVTPDSAAHYEFVLYPADLLLVNADSLSRFSDFYTSSLDSLGVTYVLWKAREDGIFPLQALDEFATRTILFFTGNSRDAALTAEERDSLASFLDSGGNFLLTGQNIGECAGTTSFYTDYLHACFLQDLYPGYMAYGIPGDSLGSRFSSFFTAGQGGAQNQNSRDEIGNDGNSHLFLSYDENGAGGAALWHENPITGSKLAYFAFGLEGVSGVSSQPQYMTRTEILRVVLNWFGIETGTEEGHGDRAVRFLLYPNPAGDEIFLVNPQVGRTTAVLYDASGRRIRSYRLSGGYREKLEIRRSDGGFLPSGIYFLRVGSSCRSFLHLR